MKTGCGYIRVSTHGKQEELSPDAQKRLIQEYAAAHNIIVNRFFVDSGISGKSADNRPAFKEMIAACRETDHPYDCVLLWKFSRFARNIDESTYYKSILRQKCNVDVISISEPIEDNMYGRLIEIIITWSDEFYSYNLAGEVRRGMTQHALIGGYNGPVPLGYVKRRGNDNLPEIDAAYGPLITRIFTEIANGAVPGNVAARLNDEGYRTRTGKKFETRIIKYIIQNPFYVGKIRFNNYDAQKYCFMKDEDKSPYVLVEGKHPRLISDALFSQANRELGSRSIAYNPRQTPSLRHAHWLSGILKCSACGGSMGFQKAHLTKSGSQVDAAFVCINYSKGRCHTTQRVRADFIANEVICNLSALLDTEFVFVKCTAAPVHEFDERVLIQAQLDSLAEKEKRIKDAYVNGIDTIVEYKDNKRLLQNTKKTLEDKLKHSAITTSTNEVTDSGEPISDIFMKLQSDISLEKKSDALSRICKKITWDKAENSIEIELISDNSSPAESGPPY